MNTLFPPGPFQQVVDVQAYMRTDAARAKRWPNIEHNLNAHTGSEHMASARRAGRWSTGQRSGGRTRWRRPRTFNSVFPSTSSTVTCKLKQSKFSSGCDVSSTYPFTRDNYLFFAWSISMRRVAWGAFPCMCLKYRKSSPRWAIDLWRERLFRSRFAKSYLWISRPIQELTSVRGFGLTAGCTSPENWNSINFHQ